MILVMKIFSFYLINSNMLVAVYGIVCDVEEEFKE